MRQMPRSFRPEVGRAQGQAYLRLVLPRLRSVSTGGGPKSGLVGLLDLAIAGGFSLWGLLCWPLPAWRPSWPPLVRRRGA